MNYRDNAMKTELSRLCQSFGWRADGDAEALINRITNHVRDLKATLKSQVVPDGYVLVRRPSWRKDAPDNGGEYVCCGGYAPCRGECAAYVASKFGDEFQDQESA